MTHSMLLNAVLKYVWMCGMAMLTIVPSSRIMKRPRQRTARTAQGLRAGLEAVASAWAGVLMAVFVLSAV